MLEKLRERAFRIGVPFASSATTPYINTIPVELQPAYPGDREIERRIKSIIRWNAMAMVVRANKLSSGIGGHISTFASAATLYEVAFNHFFRGKQGAEPPDQVFFQGHATPGIYARAFLLGRLTEQHLVNFRRELQPGGGLSSYPHPWLMPDFWEFPTVSMGLGPIMAIYQARFNHYLVDRGIKPDATASRVWAFLGDGECDEPETLGAITLAAREGLDNLIFVINCNLQRLDGPVRGNGKIVQELEGAFRGAGWNVIKVLWGSDWDPLLAKDTDGLLVRRMGEVVDGQLQKYSVMPGAYVREHFFGVDPRLKAMVEDLTDDQLISLRRGGHDPLKVYTAYKAAVEYRGAPTVILAQTVKGYGMGEAGEGRNITHQQKKLNEQELLEFRARFNIPISEEQAAHAEFYKPPEDSPEMVYLRQRRAALGGFVPGRRAPTMRLKPPKWEEFAEFFAGSEGREVSSTMAFVRLLGAAPPRQEHRPLRRADRARRGPHLRHGSPLPPVRHLLPRRPALRAGRFRQRALLSRGGRRADPGRRHQRGRVDGFVHCRREFAFQPRREHDPVLHLLLDVRLPADRRPDLGRRRHALPRLPAGRHGRPHDPGRRGPAAPGRQQPPQRPGLPHGDGLRPVLCLRVVGDRVGRHSQDVL